MVHPAAFLRIIWFSTTSPRLWEALTSQAVCWGNYSGVKLPQKAKWSFWTHITGLFLVVLAGPFWESFQMKCVSGEPAEHGTSENKANWSRKSHSLTLSLGDFNQKHRLCTTLNVCVGTKWTKWLSVTSAIKQEIVYSDTLFRNVWCPGACCTCDLCKYRHMGTLWLCYVLSFSPEMQEMILE